MEDISFFFLSQVNEFGTESDRILKRMRVKIAFMTGFIFSYEESSDGFKILYDLDKITRIIRLHAIKD